MAALVIKYLFSSVGTNTQARGIMKVASIHSLSEILMEVDCREIAQLEGEDEDNEEEDLSSLTQEELRERQDLIRMVLTLSVMTHSVG